MHTLRPTHSESCFPSSSTCSPPHLRSRPSTFCASSRSLDRLSVTAQAARAPRREQAAGSFTLASSPRPLCLRRPASVLLEALLCSVGDEAVGRTRVGRCGLQTDGESRPEVRSLLSARASCGVVAASWPRSAPPPPFLPPLARSPPRVLASTTYEHTDRCTARSRSQRTAAPPPSPAHLAVRLPRTRTRSSPRPAPVSLKVRPRSHSPPQRSTRTSS